MLKKLVLMVLSLIFLLSCSSKEENCPEPTPIVEEATKVSVPIKPAPKELNLHFTTDDTKASANTVVLKVDKYSMTKDLPFAVLVDVLKYTSDLVAYQKYLLSVINYYDPKESKGK